MPETTAEVIVGVDTHESTHTAVAVDALGRVLGTIDVSADRTGYRQLLGWARTLGSVHRAGIEGTGCYGAGLAEHLASEGIAVVEVNRPNRQARRRRGKSDPADAEAAARAVLAGDATAIPKHRTGPVEAIRVLHLTRASALKARTQAANQLKDLIVTAPDTLRAQLRHLSTTQRVRLAARWRCTPTDATRWAMRSLALRYQALTDEIRTLDTELLRLLKATAPTLLARRGVGPDSAAKLLICAGHNAHRLGTDAAFAALCGASPVDASSGKQTRHRLNRGGNRQANNALWTIAFNRLRHDDRTKTYAQRRTAEGKTRKEIIRCLKRYIARELHPIILNDLATTPHLT
jgi:transposase